VIGNDHQVRDSSLVTNEDFEKDEDADGTPDGWKFWKWGREKKVVICVDRETVYSGQSSFRISCDAAVVAGLQKNIFLQPGHRYKMLVWCKSEDFSGHVEIGGDRNNGGGYVCAHLWGQNDKWMGLGTVFTMPDTSDILTLKCFIDGRGTVWFDNLEIVDMSKTP